MLQCHAGCNEWFHSKCIGIDASDVKEAERGKPSGHVVYYECDVCKAAAVADTKSEATSTSYISRKKRKCDADANGKRGFGLNVAEKLSNIVDLGASPIRRRPSPPSAFFTPPASTTASGAGTPAMELVPM